MRLPPLNAIRVFEAAGRHRSFSKAAVELHVTPGAVSRQIAKLEDFLGLPLFERGGAELRLTPAGERYLGHVRDSLDRLRSGTRDLRDKGCDDTLHIWGSRFFIRIWLLPRLSEFHAQHPGQQVRITTALPEEAPPPGVDVAILPGDDAAPGMALHRLIERVLIPVCSPAYLAGAPPLRQPQDLARHTLIETQRDAGDWSRWYAVTEAPAVALPRRVTFTSADIAYSAALDGIGIALGRRGFIDTDVDAGRLVMPFDVPLVAGNAFCLLYREADGALPRVARFRDWLLERLKREPP
jgi:LysR family glycine cleavage system transcriptional activator